MSEVITTIVLFRSAESLITSTILFASKIVGVYPAGLLGKFNMIIFYCL